MSSSTATNYPAIPSRSIKIFIIFTLFLAACGSSNKQAQDSENSKDSLIHNNDSMPKPPPPPPGLSPGHAKIKGKLLSITEDAKKNSRKNLIFRVDDILGYGSATPPIASDDTLHIAISNEEIEKNKALNPDTNFTLLVQHLQIPALGDSKEPIWVFRNLTTD